jgi:hypothetical protein
MAEAPPSSPGHAGYTPQHVDTMLRRSRLAGLLSSVAIRYREWLPMEFSSAQFRQLQRFTEASSEESLARAAYYTEQMRSINPKPDPRPESGLAAAEDPAFVVRYE